MICQECHKREATLHIKKMVNGVKEDRLLCEVCASKKSSFPSEKFFNLNQLLSGMMEMEGESSQASLPKDGKVQCSNCGMTYDLFKELGRFGCARCYTTFQEKIQPLFRKIHGNTEHTGKFPKGRGKEIGIQGKIKALKSQMQRAIDKEAFEEAAKIRDEIKALEKDL